MGKTIYEPIRAAEEDAPATKADVERILRAIEYLAEQIGRHF